MELKMLVNYNATRWNIRLFQFTATSTTIIHLVFMLKSNGGDANVTMEVLIASKH